MSEATESEAIVAESPVMESLIAERGANAMLSSASSVSMVSLRSTLLAGAMRRREAIESPTGWGLRICFSLPADEESSRSREESEMTATGSGVIATESGLTGRDIAPTERAHNSTIRIIYV